MNNYVQPGQVLTLTAPAGGVVSGGGYQIGQLFVVAANSAPEAEPFEGQSVGVFELPKSGDGWAEGALVFWDDDAREVTADPDENLLIGCAAVAVLPANAVGRVRLNGVAVPNAE